MIQLSSWEGCIKGASAPKGESIGRDSGMVFEGKFTGFWKKKVAI
jgi:hypothetical protein